MAERPDHPLLSSLLNQLEANSAQFENLIADTSEAGLLWRPHPGSWSVAECLEHLNITFASYEDGLSGAIDRADQGHGPHKPSLIGKLFLKGVQPGGKKLKAPSTFQPAADADLNVEAVAASFREYQDRLATLIRRADGRTLNRPKLASPVTSLVRFNPGDALRILVAHQTRHLQQAAAVKEAPGFPG